MWDVPGSKSTVHVTSFSATLLTPLDRWNAIVFDPNVHSVARLRESATTSVRRCEKLNSLMRIWFYPPGLEATLHPFQILGARSFNARWKLSRRLMMEIMKSLSGYLILDSPHRIETWHPSSLPELKLYGNFNHHWLMSSLFQLLENRSS